MRPDKPTDKLSLIFNALAHPIRREILMSLQKGDLSVNEITRPFQISQPAITKHLKILESAGLIYRKKKAQISYSSIKMNSLKEVIQWLESYEKEWHDRLIRLQSILDEADNDF